MTQFPRVGALARGYDVEQVDAFFVRARVAYENSDSAALAGVDSSKDALAPASEDPSDPADLALVSQDVREVAFDLVRHGYSPTAVDAALDRLEAAFVAAARADFIAENGQSAWMETVVKRATTLYERLTRPEGARFAPPSRGRGYDAAQVDALLGRVVDYFDDGKALRAAEIRTTSFATASRGNAYAEGPVDAYLDRVVDVLLAVE